MKAEKYFFQELHYVLSTTLQGAPHIQKKIKQYKMDSIFLYGVSLFWRFLYY